MFKALQDTTAALARQLEDINRKNTELMELAALQSQQIKDLLQKIDTLTGGSKDSHNSSKPPSSDGYAKKPAPKSLRHPAVPGVLLRCRHPVLLPPEPIL